MSSDPYHDEGLLPNRAGEHIRLARDRKLQLTRWVPPQEGYTERKGLVWIHREFMTHGFYRRAREGAGLGVVLDCQWCGAPFNDDEMMALAGARDGNLLVCQHCADVAENNAGEGE